MRPTLVLIPLLVDDPLWAYGLRLMVLPVRVLIPLLVDDPLWVLSQTNSTPTQWGVLIPLLVDDPLWAEKYRVNIEKCES